MHLAIVFPTPLPRQPRRWLIVAYGVGLASGVLLAATRHRWWARVPLEQAQAADDAAYMTMLVLLLMGVVALFARLIWSWIYERRTRRQRRAAGIVLVGMAGALPMLFYLIIAADRPDTSLSPTGAGWTCVIRCWPSPSRSPSSSSAIRRSGAVFVVYGCAAWR
jgi:hypothetical protein